MNRVLITALSAAVLTAGASNATQTPVRDLQLKRQSAATLSLQDAAPAASGFVLKELLRDGYEIIHVDAPVGTANARFILRKSDTIYSCDPVMFREGGGEEAIRILPTPCLNLTP